MKELQDESETTSKSESKDQGEVKSNQRGGGVKDVGVVKGRGEVGPAIQVRSVTLKGLGDGSGRDINNSMSLGGFYRLMLAKDVKGKDEKTL